MNALPEHASRELCKRERGTMRERFEHRRMLGVTCADIFWLLDECDWLYREAEDAWRELRRQQDGVARS